METFLYINMFVNRHWDSMTESVNICLGGKPSSGCPGTLGTSYYLTEGHACERSPPAPFGSGSAWDTVYDKGRHAKRQFFYTNIVSAPKSLKLNSA